MLFLRVCERTPFDIGLTSSTHFHSSNRIWGTQTHLARMQYFSEIYFLYTQNRSVQHHTYIQRNTPTVCVQLPHQPRFCHIQMNTKYQPNVSVIHRIRWLLSSQHTHTHNFCQYFRRQRLVRCRWPYSSSDLLAGQRRCGHTFRQSKAMTTELLIPWASQHVYSQYRMAIWLLGVFDCRGSIA